MTQKSKTEGGGRTYRGRAGWCGVPRRPEEGKEGGNSLPFPKGGGRIVVACSPAGSVRKEGGDGTGGAGPLRRSRRPEGGSLAASAAVLRARPPEIGCR
ncbi:hypothetical protein DESPIG_01895 [Desulfovibrio piger ATCC 29098]|uniref:Uncharacterized protein n=1 Tax=Desulfovibrio piger ATCC 29098 TaxID=411464 RepID=B6WUY0_9BACT|nr:hypothetical protein DESPIG_01895 [Desulfovibrio piger ATCC 29098]